MHGAWVSIVRLLLAGPPIDRLTLDRMAIEMAGCELREVAALWWLSVNVLRDKKGVQEQDFPELYAAIEQEIVHTAMNHIKMPTHLEH